MNDTEIRERLRAAVGEQSYPADLSARAETRLKQPPEVETHPRALGLVAALLAIAIVAALFGPRLLAYRNTQPRPALPPASVASPTPVAGQVPDADLAVVGLTGQGDLVTPLQITKQFGNSHVTVIGAYADPARTVLFFRTPDAGYPMVSINDDYGFINASSSGTGGASGDYVFILDAGPRPGADGTAHLKVSVTGFMPAAGPASGPPIQANWTFSLQLPLQQSILVAAVPQRFLLGAWTVTLEVADATPSVVRAQVLIDGVSPGDIGGAFPVTLVDAAGTPLIQTAASAGVTVPKGQLDSSNYKRTRLYAAWKRPAAAGTYQLRFEGSGAVVKIPVNIPAPNTKGVGPSPTDFPSADQSLTLSGSLTANITTGRPSQCGSGAGPSGAIFVFATYFQSGDTWFWLGFSSDPSVKQYSGPGTYTAIGSLYAVGPNGPNNVLYKGTVQLTVTSDGRLDTGTVSGTLNGLEVIASQSQVVVGGGWTCSPRPSLGPG
jgi:hypothetical protein